MAISEVKTSKLLNSFKENIKHAENKVHVIPTQQGWSVKKGRSVRAYRAGRSFEEAVRIAKGFKSANEMIIHHKDGKYDRIAINA